jgi:hypothetical protein
MHYQIAQGDLQLHHVSTCEVHNSRLKAGVKNPHMHPGKGLFTTIPRKKDEHIISFPGYWMNSQAYGNKAKLGESYAFCMPVDDRGWDYIKDMVYVAHESQANFINAGIVGKEVQTITLQPIHNAFVRLPSLHQSI